MSAVNVNLRPCVCPVGWPAADGGHFPRLSEAMGCDAAPILIPCPIPRSVVFAVTLGECVCPARAIPTGAPHRDYCPGRPTRVVCDIGGKDWASSEVTDVDNPHDPNGRWGAGSGDLFRSTIAACRARWEVVKSVLLKGRVPNITGFGPAATETVFRLCEQHKTVFAALARLVQAEEAIHLGEASLLERIPRTIAPPLWHTHSVHGEVRPSGRWLSAYVDLLIEQVGAL